MDLVDLRPLWNGNGDLIGVEHRRSLLESTSYWRDEDSFKSKEIILTPEKRITWTSARIESSLFLAGQSAGLTNNSIMELANIFGGVIDLEAEDFIMSKHASCNYCICSYELSSIP